VIPKFDAATALLLIDVQQGVDDLAYYGGPTGRSNNPLAKDNIRTLLTTWRESGGKVAFTQHDSIEAESPLKLSLDSGQQLPGMEIHDTDIAVSKSVNSGFIGTSLELQLRRAGIQRLVVAGFFTNYCVETTVRMAGNMGFDTFLVHDACSTTNTIGIDGTDYDPELVHNMAIASLHGEFCTAISLSEALHLINALPGNALLNADREQWHYGERFDPVHVVAEHQAFTSLLSQSGAQVIWMNNDDHGIADAVFTYDASLITPKGAVLMSPGKLLRRDEQHVHAVFYGEQNIPVIGEITGAARAEAGDTLWLADDVLAVARGYRTNDLGVEQLTLLMNSIGITVRAFDIPYYRGQAACLVPVALHQLLLEMGFEVIAAPFDEFQASDTLSTNVLAMSPGHCIMLDGIPKTRAALQQAGVEVQVFQGDALCIGCEGGPTCLTRPILRAG